jgi:hypothetical protein
VENEKWFLNLGESEFKQLCLQWIKHHTGTDIPKLASYDEWLNYFKTLSPLQIKALGDAGQGFLSTEAYAALTRWADILKSPHRIDKIYQAGLTKPKTEQKSIIELAKSNDKLGLLYAIRDQIAEKLEKGAGARDTANLAREMGEILDQISEAEKRQGPAKNTKLAELLGNVEMPNKVSGKRKQGNGARDRSYASKLTIEDVENE